MTSPTLTAENYAYDQVGNRTSSHLSATYTTGTFNKLSATANSNFTYDANGNLVLKTTGAAAWGYYWDYENRMTSATDTTKTISYEYDGLGRRTKRTKGPGTPLPVPTPTATPTPTPTPTPAPDFTLTPSVTSVTQGVSLDVSWTAPAGQSTTDWVGLFKVGDPNTTNYWWQYTGGAASGTLTLTAPVPEEYEFRYLLNNGYTSVATSATVTVLSAFVMTPSVTSVAPGGSLSVSWTVPAGQSTTDWIGLYKVGDPNTAHQWWQYTGGTTSGTLALTAPGTPGSYEFRYLLNNGWTSVGTSVTVTVTSGSSQAANVSKESAPSASDVWRGIPSWFGSRVEEKKDEASSQATEITKYSYDGLDVIQDDHSVNGITRYQNGLGIDNKLRSEKGSNVQYFLTDHLGSTSALADSSGTISSSTSYDSYGNPASSINTRYQYTGREMDADTGLYYYRNRWYDSETGRFISEDSIGFAGGDANLFGYVWNSPNGFTDPMGLDGWGNDFADWLDREIEKVRRYNQGGYQNWVWNGTVDTIADLSRIGADVFRLGSGIGCAVFNDQASGYDKAWAVAADVGRGLAIAGGVGGGLGRTAQLAKGLKRGTTMPTLSRSSTRDLLNTGKALDRNNLTKVGRALQKHGHRQGSKFPRVNGKDLNSRGQEILNDILNSSSQSTKPNRFGGLDIFDNVTGRGVRFDLNEKMIGFLD